MSHNRLETAGKAANKRAAATPGDIVAPCPATCADRWRDVDAEAAQAVKSDDPLERNKKISTAYAGMNLRRPDLQWIGLAAVVSRQAGCAMQYADEKGNNWNPLVSTPAKVAKQALAETNKLIFSDIYPAMRFYERFGGTALDACKDERPSGEPVPTQLLQATRAIDAGDTQGASDQIAIYEQKTIVQTRIYNRATYRETFESNERWAKQSIGRYFGARPAEIPLSSTCTKGNEVPFSGSIGNADDRVGYYQALTKAFNDKPAGWREETMSSIIANGQ